MTELSIVLATYNEAANIAELITRIEPFVQDIDTEIIVVDDNSPDHTAQVANKVGKQYGNVRVLVRTKERGLASALIRGFEESKGDYILCMDCDLAHDPKHLPEMLALLKSNEADFVIGSRYIKGAKVVGKPFIKNAASRVAQFIASLVIGLNVKDATNNFRLFRREVYESVKDHLHPDGNVMIMELAYRAQRKGYMIKELPILYREREHGETKLKLLPEIKRFMKAIWRMRFG